MHRLPRRLRAQGRTISHALFFAAAAAAPAALAGPAMAAGGVFSTATYSGASGSSTQMNDTNIGVSSTYLYQNSANINGPAVTITPSTGSPVTFNAGGLNSGTNWTLSGASNSFTNASSNVSGGVGTMLSDFTYGGNPAAFTESGLTVGQTYVLTFYNQSFGTTDNRTQTIVASDGGTGTYDEDPGTAGDGNLLRYTFVANAASESLTITPTTAASMHFYGFSNQQVFTNTYTGSGGSFNDNTAWSNSAVPALNGMAPNGVGTNAELPAQPQATYISLDSPTTLGHIQFDGTGSYNLVGVNTLTFQTDPGGASVMNVPDPAGVHTIAVPVALQSPAAKLGPGTLVFSNFITSNGNPITVNGGTLQFGDNVSSNGNTDGPITNNSVVSFANTAAQTYSGTISGTGNLTTIGSATLVLAGSNTFSGTTTIGPNETLQLNNTNALQNSALTTDGGALVFVSGVTNFSIGALNGSKAVALVDSGGTAINLTLGGVSTSGNYAGALTGAGSLTKVGSGTQVLSGSSSYTGVTTIGGGILNVSKLTDYGVNGPLGARLASQEAASDVGLHFTGGTLQYTGSTPTSTNRQIRILAGTGSAIDASGTTPSATMNFTYSGANTDLFDSPGTRTFTLTGTNAGNNFFDIQLTDQGGNPTTLNKTGVGTWVLGATASTYSGGTNVQNGTLAVDPAAGSLPAGGTVSLGSGSTPGVLALGDSSSNVTVSQTIGGLTSGNVVPGSAVINGSTGLANLTINSAISSAYGGVIGGTGAQSGISLTKTGPATFFLASPGGSNNYTGPTQINNGTLALGGLGSTAVATYHFEGNANDSSGNGNTATLVGGPAYVAGVNGGQAISFNGSSQYATVPYSSSLNVQGQYTVSFWEKLNAPITSPGQTFISTRNGSDVSAIDVQSTATGVHADIGGSIPGYSGTYWFSTSADASLSLGTNWNMVTYAITNSGYSIYFNGALVTNSPFQNFTGYNRNPILMTSAQTLSIGSQEAGGATYDPGSDLNGSMDEVNIFNSALSTAQIQALYNLELGTTPAAVNILPVGTPLQIASGATLDLQGTSQTVASISDVVPGAGGTITNTSGSPATLTDNLATGTATYSGVITDNGPLQAVSFVKAGNGTQVLAGSSTFSGSTTVSGGTLLITGSLPAGGTVMVAANATLGGSGSVGPITAAGASAGIIAPLSLGSPSILSAPSVAGGSGLQFKFQFTQASGQSPNYATPAASGNDLLNLTGMPAIGNGGLTSGNSVGIYLPASLAAGQTFKGGFYAASDTNLAAEVAAASFRFYEATANGGANDAVTYNGVAYQPVSDFGLTVATSVTMESAAFPSGTENGSITQFTVTAVPEPTALALLGLATVGLLARRRRATLPAC
ncbi:MAG TPA: autotransporter-associated beta strand repeat-containing protein [Tepidisphaeraceae bacterium]|nr:autotransporter-associated beta strand repeat-containing protein [Tepidisphaeraceae bacterium]